MSQTVQPPLPPKKKQKNTFVKICEGGHYKEPQKGWFCRVQVNPTRCLLKLRGIAAERSRPRAQRFEPSTEP